MCRGSVRGRSPRPRRRAAPHPGSHARRNASPPVAESARTPSWSSLRLLLVVSEADRGVRAVAEWLVPRGTAPTQRDAVAHLVLRAVGCRHRNPPPHPNRAGDLLARVLHEADRRLELLLERSTTAPVPGNESTGGAELRFLHCQGCGLLTRLLHQVPHLTANVTEPRERAQPLVVRQRNERTVLFNGLSTVRRSARRLSPVEADTQVRLVAVGLVRRLAAPAEAVFLRGLERFPLLPPDRGSFVVGHDHLSRERDTSGHLVRPVCGHSDRHMVWRPRVRRRW